MDVRTGKHSLVCKQAPSKIAGHQAINDVIARAITAAGYHGKAANL